MRHLWYGLLDWPCVPLGAYTITIIYNNSVIIGFNVFAHGLQKQGQLRVLNANQVFLFILVPTASVPAGGRL